MTDDSGVHVFSARPEGWAELARGGSPLAQERWLRLMNGRLEGASHYFCLEDKGALSTGAHGVLIEDRDCYEAYNVRLLLAEEPSVFPRGAREQEAVVALLQELPCAERWFPNLVMMFPGYECASVGKDRSPAALHRLVRGVRGWAAQQGAALLAFLYLPPEEPLREVLREQGFCRVPLTFRSELELPGGSTFADYLARLPRRDRKEARREMRLLQAAGVRTVQRPLWACYERILRLRVLLTEKYGGYSSPDKERDRLTKLAAAYDFEDVLVLCAEDEQGDLLGFSLFLQEGDRWTAFWTGSDYTNPKSRYVYFDTLFYSAVPLALKRGVRTIQYGIGHWEGKAARGCRSVPVDGWVIGVGELNQREENV